MWTKFSYFFNIILILINRSFNNRIIIPLKIIDNHNTGLNYIESILQNQLYAEIKLGTPQQNVYLSISTETENFSIESRYINDKFYFHNDSSTYINTDKKISFYHERYKSGNIFKDNFYFQRDFDEKKYYIYNNLSFDYIYELSEEFTNYEKNYFIDKYKNQISGKIGLQIPKSYISSSNFLKSLNNINATDSYIWSLIFIKEENNQAYLIIGENLFQQNYNYNDNKCTSAYLSGIDSYWFFYFSDIIIGNIKLNKERIAEYSPQIGAIIGTDEYKNYINNNFFVNLTKENICIQKNISFNKEIYSYYECDKSININNFEPIIFTHQELSYNFTLDKNDLFVDFNNKKYFLCLFLEKKYSNEERHWILGMPFIKKYNFVFDNNLKKIFFYENEYEYRKQGKMGWFVWVLIIALATFTSLLGLYLLFKIIFRPKRINANELEDSFNIQKNTKYDVDLGSFYNSKYNKLGV